MAFFGVHTKKVPLVLLAVRPSLDALGIYVAGPPPTRGEG
jgi:hypothetical protein